MKRNRSIDRGLSVLEAVQDSGVMSLAALARRTDLPKATLLRICATLEARRWLVRRSSDGHYQLGSAFPRGQGRPGRVDRLVAVAKEELLRLSQDTGLGSDLAAAVGGGRIEIVDSTRAYPLHGVYPDTVGFRPSPILSALGTAYLSALSGGDRGQALHDLVDRLPRAEAAAISGLPAVLQGISRRGYAIRPEGYWGRAVDYGALPAAIAVPVIADSEALGAVNLGWTALDQTVETVAEQHLARLQAAAREIGRLYATPAG